MSRPADFSLPAGRRNRHPDYHCTVEAPPDARTPDGAWGCDGSFGGLHHLFVERMNRIDEAQHGRR